MEIGQGFDPASGLRVEVQAAGQGIGVVRPSLQHALEHGECRTGAAENQPGYGQTLEHKTIETVHRQPTMPTLTHRRIFSKVTTAQLSSSTKKATKGTCRSATRRGVRRRATAVKGRVRICSNW